jgi:hypothetical protein
MNLILSALAIIVISLGVILLSLVVIFWLYRRNHSQRRPLETPGRAGQDGKINTNQEIPAGDDEPAADELDESQAAEIVTTWNILNPPN